MPRAHPKGVLENTTPVFALLSTISKTNPRIAPTSLHFRFHVHVEIHNTCRRANPSSKHVPIRGHPPRQGRCAIHAVFPAIQPSPRVPSAVTATSISQHSRHISAAPIPNAEVPLFVSTVFPSAPRMNPLIDQTIPIASLKSSPSLSTSAIGPPMRSFVYWKPSVNMVHTTGRPSRTTSERPKGNASHITRPCISKVRLHLCQLVCLVNQPLPHPLPQVPMR